MFRAKRALNIIYRCVSFEFELSLGGLIFHPGMMKFTQMLLLEQLLLELQLELELQLLRGVGRRVHHRP